MENANITEQDARGLLPYPVIIAASKGDPDAMRIVVHHYESYIAFLSMRKFRDEPATATSAWTRTSATNCVHV